MPDDGLAQVAEARSDAAQAARRTDAQTDGRDDWATRSKRYIKRELKHKEITYEELARRLGQMGIQETPGSIAMKVSRGLYPAWFFFAVMEAIGCQEMRFSDLRR
jgi:hypothetical protein